MTNDVAPLRLSKRKLESYRRAEVVAQAARNYISLGPRVTQNDINILIDACLDWMDVTGKVKYDLPVRRSNIKRR